MNHRNNSKTSLFLMELIIAILFFSLASAVCVRLFTAAHKMSDNSINLSNAVKWSQNLSEAFYGTRGDATELAKLYPEAFLSYDPDTDVNTLILFFDENWVLNNSENLIDASYEAVLEIQKQSAEQVYSDVNAYDTALLGNAMTGKIAVIDLRETTEVFSEIPETSDRIMHSATIDQYVGK